MSGDRSGWAVVVGVVVTVILLAAGLAMVSEAPSAADAAVGKGLLVLGACVAVVTAALVGFAMSVTRTPRRPAESTGLDWFE